MTLDCLPFQTLEMEEWTHQLTAPLSGKRFPLSATFEITNRCNMGCVHCFINEPPNAQVVKDRELSTDQIKRLIDQMVEMGCLFLTITGGEPLLRDDFGEVYRYAIRKGLLVVLFTNGTRLTEEIADMLDEYRPFMIEITLYGATASTYEKMTRVPGSYQDCRNGIDRIKQRGLPLRLKSELTTVNKHEILEMKALSEKLGCDFRYDGLLWPRTDGDRRPLKYQIPLRELLDLDLIDPSRKDAEIAEADRLRNHKIRGERIYSCGAGHNNFHVTSSGEMSICLMSRRPVFDLKTMSMQEAWGKIGELRELKRHLPSECNSCTINQLCTQCPAWSQAYFGDDESIVPFVCELGRSRSQRASKL